MAVNILFLAMLTCVMVMDIFNLVMTVKMYYGGDD